MKVYTCDPPDRRRRRARVFVLASLLYESTQHHIHTVQQLTHYTWARFFYWFTWFMLLLGQSRSSVSHVIEFIVFKYHVYGLDLLCSSLLATKSCISNIFKDEFSMHFSANGGLVQPKESSWMATPRFKRSHVAFLWNMCLLECYICGSFAWNLSNNFSDFLV